MRLKKFLKVSILINSFLETLTRENINIVFKEINYYKKTTNLYKFKLIVSIDKKFLYFFYETPYGLNYIDFSIIDISEESTIENFKNLAETKAREIIFSFNTSESSSTYSMIHFGI